MTISFVARTVTTGGAAEPAGTAQGDIVFCLAYSGTASAPGAPAGWTQAGSTLVGGGHDANLWWIVRGSSAPSYTFTNVGSGRTRTVTIRGASNVDAVGSSSNASAVAPSVTAAKGNEWLTCWYVDDSSTGINGPTGMTTPNPGGTITQFSYLDLTPNSGATGTQTFTGTTTPIGAWSVTLFNGTADLSSTITASTTITANVTNTVALSQNVTDTSTVTANKTDNATLSSGKTITATSTVSAALATLAEGSTNTIDTATASVSALSLADINGAATVSAIVNLIAQKHPVIITVELFVNNNWVDVSNYVLYRVLIGVARGRRNESSIADVSSMTLSLINSDGRFTEYNPNGPYYGSLHLNTPARVSTLDSLSRLIIPADDNSTAGYYDIITTTESLGAATALGITVSSDLELQFDGFSYDWGIYTQRLINKNDSSGINVGYVLSTVYGYVRLYWSSDGSTIQYAQSTYPLPKPWHGRKAIRATLQLNVGGNYQVSFYYANSFSDATNNGWTQLGTTVMGAGATTVYASTAIVSIGYTWIGFVYGTKIYSGLSTSGGTLVASPDFTIQPDAINSFIDAQSNIWTLTGSSEIIRKQYRFHGQLGSAAYKWDVTGRDVYAEMTFSGLMRRISQGTALASAYYRGMTLSPPASVVAYWPCEDSADASWLTAVNFTGSSIPPITFVGSPQLANSSVFACSLPLPVVNKAVFTARLSASATSSNSSVGFLSYASSSLTANVIVCRIWLNGTIGHLDLQYIDDNTIGVTSYDQSGAQIDTHAVSGFAWKSSYYVQVDFATTGSSTVYTVSWLFPSDSSGLTYSSTISGTVTGISSVQFGPNADLTTYSFGHLTIFNTIPSVFSRGNLLSSWNGENATRRIARLCSEENVSCFIYGSDSGAAMGPQGVDTLLNLLRDCEAVDDGILFESRDRIGLVYRSRDSMATYAGPVIAANYTNADLFNIEPSDDDLLVKNDITYSRKAGSSSRRILRASKYTVNRATSDIGTYSDSKTINAYSDGSLIGHASWRLHLGTVSELRFPSITFNMVRPELANTALGTAVANAEIGDLLTVSNPPNSFLVFDTIRQIIQGYTEKFTSTTWEIQFNLSPASPYDIGQYNDGGTTRYDTEGSVLTSDIGTSDTVFFVNTTSGYRWTIDPNAFPFDIVIDGERMTVSLIENTTNPQKFTVTRSVNGVTRTHGFNSNVSLFRPSYYALDSGSSTSFSTTSGSGTGTGGGSGSSSGGGNSGGTTSTTITIVGTTSGPGNLGTEPTGAQAGDLLIASAMTSDGPAGPTGWTKVGTNIVGNGQHIGCWYIIRGASAPSYQWLSSQNDGGYAVICIRGAASVLDATGRSIDGTPVSPSVNATTTSDLLVSLYGDASATALIPPNGMTLNGGTTGVTIATKQLNATGATGTEIWNNVVAPVGTWTVAVKPGTVSGGGSTGTGTITKLLVIIDENHTAAQVAAGMPYLTGLGNSYAYSSNYKAVSHPSLPNYLAIVSGSTYGITDDNNPPSHVLTGFSTIFGQAIAAGKTAKSYMETMPSNAYASDSGNYSAHHNPWIYFPGESGSYNTYDIPAGTTSSGNLHNDVSGNTLPNISFVVPDNSNNAHDGTLATADSWLSGWIPLIMGTADYTNNKLLIAIIWDEDDGSGDNTVSAVFIHPTLAGKGANSVSLNHYSITRLAAEILGTNPLQNGASANSIKDAFSLPIGSTSNSGGGGTGTGGGTIGGGGTGGAGSGGNFVPGASGAGVGNGNFNNWLASHDLGAASTWSDTDVGSQTSGGGIGPGQEFGSWGGIINLAIGGIFGGDSWSAAAAGSYNSRWTTALNNIKAKWGSRPAGNLHIRFAHEYNGSFSAWAVSDGNVSNFVTAFQGFVTLQRSIIPGSIAVWSPNYGTSSMSNLDSSYPGSSYVDVIGPDWYNDYGSPHQHAVSAQDFTDNLNYSPGGNPQGLGSWLSYAASKGKPMCLPEFGNPAIDTGGGAGGGEAPGWATAFISWCKTNGGTGSGQIWYANYFNISNGYSAKFGIYNDGSDASVSQPQTAAVFQANW